MLHLLFVAPHRDVDMVHHLSSFPRGDNTFIKAYCYCAEPVLACDELDATYWDFEGFDYRRLQN
jgi:hypothetical protein